MPFVLSWRENTYSVHYITGQYLQPSTSLDGLKTSTPYYIRICRQVPGVTSSCKLKHQGSNIQNKPQLAIILIANFLKINSHTALFTFFFIGILPFLVLTAHK